MIIKSCILGAVLCCIVHSRHRVPRQVASEPSQDSNHTGHSFVNATGLDTAMQQWLDVIYQAQGGIRYGAGGVAQGDNDSLVFTSGAGTTSLLNGSTDGSSASSNVTAIGVQSLAQGNSTGLEFNGTQWATADGLALSFGSGQSAAGISGVVQTIDKNITNPFGVSSLTGSSQSGGDQDTNSVVQSSQTLNFSSILAELTANALAQSVNDSSAAVEGAFEGVSGKSINFNANSSIQSNNGSTSQVDGSLSVANDTHIVSASVSGSGEGREHANVASNAAVGDNSGGIETNNNAGSVVDIGQTAVGTDSDLTRISNGTNQVSNTVSGGAFGFNRNVTGDGTFRQFDENNNTLTNANGNGQSDGSGNVNGNSSMMAMTNQGEAGGATVVVLSSGNSASENNSTAVISLHNTGQLESNGRQPNANDGSI
uniref:Uncharacterized protein n=1 Tax=Plectus sambesii TaxID=2011161 RepID=A0A914WN58_9BILA